MLPAPISAVADCRPPLPHTHRSAPAAAADIGAREAGYSLAGSGPLGAPYTAAGADSDSCLSAGGQRGRGCGGLTATVGLQAVETW